MLVLLRNPKHGLLGLLVMHVFGERAHFLSTAPLGIIDVGRRYGCPLPEHRSLSASREPD